MVSFDSFPLLFYSHSLAWRESLLPLLFPFWTWKWRVPCSPSQIHPSSSPSLSCLASTSIHRKYPFLSFPRYDFNFFVIFNKFYPILLFLFGISVVFVQISAYSVFTSDLSILISKCSKARWVLNQIAWEFASITKVLYINRMKLIAEPIPRVGFSIIRFL